MSYTVSYIRVLIEKAVKSIDKIPHCGHSAVFKIAQDILNNAHSAFDINYTLTPNIGAVTITVDGNVVYTLDSPFLGEPDLVVPSSTLLHQIALAASQGQELVLSVPNVWAIVPETLYLYAFAIVAKVLNPRCALNVADLMKVNSRILFLYFVYKQFTNPDVDSNSATLIFWKVMENVIYAGRGAHVHRGQLVLAVDKFNILEGSLKSLVCPKTFWYNNRIIYKSYDSRDCNVPAGLYSNSSCDFAITTDECEPSLIKAINMKKVIH